ncbi:radial spoke head 4 -like protein, partial [Brachionus plicatilis]
YSTRAYSVQEMSENTEIEQKFQDAKAYLLQSSTKSGDNVYDHLAKVLTRLLTERPTDAVDVLEDISRLEKKEKFVSKTDTIIDKPEKSTETKLAEIQRGLYIREGEEEENIGDMDESETPLPNLLELSYYFEQAGVGIGREETYRIWLALKQLVEKYALESIRFWGKVFGIEQNYYVAELKFQEGKDEEEPEEEEEAEEAEKEESEENEEEDPVPKSTFKAPAQAPKELYGTGSNKYVYYVCNAPGKPWTRLPNVTPSQISGARKIRKYLTGRLDAPVVSYPPFPGNEASYLRAQIARISAGTHISPIGYYKFDEEGEAEGEEDGGRDSFIQNEEFEGLPSRELIDTANWVHHVLHILPQGRTKWWNPSQKGDDDPEIGEEEEEKEEPDMPEPEVGPQLLTPLTEDFEIDGQPAWTARSSSNLVTQFACAYVRSNLWPGAFAFGTEKKFENIYVGWGQKYSVDNLNPVLPPLPQSEYVSGPEITETEDPTVLQEEALKKAQETSGDGEEEQSDEDKVEADEDEDDED